MLKNTKIKEKEREYYNSGQMCKDNPAFDHPTVSFHYYYNVTSD